MTILTELARLYERLAANGRAPRAGYSTEKISFAIEIDAEGRLVALRDKRSLAGKKPAAVPMAVPASSTRTSGVAPNLFWDKTAYVLGVIAVEQDDKTVVPGQGPRTAKEHAAFVEAHRSMLADAADPGLVALRRFLEDWTPDQFVARGLDVAALDQNLVFEFAEAGRRGFIHDRPAATALLAGEDQTEERPCLVTGQPGPLARLHPAIKGVKDAQSSGAFLVAFELVPSRSYGKEKGDNAPVSQAAAFAYGAALNALLERKPARADERHLRVGDMTVAFWAEAAQAEAADWAEMVIGQALNPPDEDAETALLQAALADVAAGRGGADPRFDPETRVFLLGLAPNAARLSVRLWHPGTFGGFARNVQRFWADLAIEPSPWKRPPAAWSLMNEIERKHWDERGKRWVFERDHSRDRKPTAPKIVGGQMMRAVLTGQPLPRSLLAAVIARIRADGDINGRRAAICKAVINRHDTQEEIPVSLDPDNPSPAYRLGRLFAVLENIQQSALPGLNATIKDRYFAAASATPARVFPLLVKNATHHLALMRKEGGGLGHWLDARMGSIWLGLGPDLPRSLNLEDQGRFVAGYYHERFTRKPKDTDDLIEQPETADDAR